MSTVQTYIPRAVAEALPIQGIAAEARGVGLAGATLQYSNTRWRPAETLVTCQLPVAKFLLGRLQRLEVEAHALGHDELLEPAKRAVSALEDAIAHPYSPEGGPAEGIAKGMG